MTWTLVINRPVPSANDHVVNGRDAVAAAIYRRRRNAWATDISVTFQSLLLQDGPTKAPPPRAVSFEHRPQRRIVLTRIMGPRQRAYDDDNMRAGCKLIIDAMKPPRPGAVTKFKSGKRKGQTRIVKPILGAALIVDDSPKWVEVEYRQERGEAPGCRIEIDDI